MDIYEAVTSRRSIRRFKDIAVPYDILEKCVNAARLAPSARNNQLCEYMIIDDEQLLPKVFDTVGSWGGVARPKGGAPPGHRPKAYITSLINVALETKLGGTRRVTAYDVGIAAGNMILVALEQGLGACPLLSFREDELRPILNVPESYEIALVLALGYPDEHPVQEVSSGPVELWTDSQGIRHVPKRKLEDIAHRNKFP
jgi:nitroreductase